MRILRVKILISTLILVLLSQNCIAAPDIEKAPGVFDMFTNLPGDWAEWGRREWKREKIPAWTVVTSLTALGIGTDWQVWQWSRRPYHDNEMYRNWANAGVYIGDGAPQFGVAGAFALTGAITGNNRALRTASQIVEVILANGIVIQLLKHTTGRESPSATTTRTGKWRFFPSPVAYHKRVSKYDAFPSGHSATTLATYLVIKDNYPDQWWLDIIGFGSVGLVVWGLMATDMHWWSDYPLGLYLGWTFAKTVTRRNHPEKIAKKESALVPDMAVLPSPFEQPQLALTWRW